MSVYLVTFTSGPPLHVNAPGPEEAKAHATTATTYRIDGEVVLTRGVPVGADLVKA